MLFNSLHFVAFFIVVTTLYFSLPHKFRWMLLLLSSFYFYMAFLPVYVLILLVTIIIDYFAGIYIARSQGKRRKLYLIISLIANVGFLSFFKYYDFLIESLNDLLNVHLPYMKDLWLASKIIVWNNWVNSHLNLMGTDLPILRNIILPIGLSFHTFQAMSYTIEVYRGNQKPETNFGIYSLYVMFYPQLVAGPIERPQNVLHQFYRKHEFSYDRAVSGLRLILWGMVKKVVIADRLAIYDNAIFSNLSHHSAPTLIMASIFGPIQVYCDFSAYSDIAVGAARVMGFELMTNFRRPLLARSFQELWQRWHISLTTWFRDYLFFPLGGSKRKGKLRGAFNLVFVFMVSGLWHGASWCFVLWGFTQGMLLVIERLIRPYTSKIVRLLGRASTAISTATVFMIFGFSNAMFVSSDLRNVAGYYRNILTWKAGGLYKGEPPTALAYCIIVVLILFAAEYTMEYKPQIKLLGHPNVVVRYAGYVMLLTLLLLIGVFNGGQFVYFQF